MVTALRKLAEFDYSVADDQSGTVFRLRPLSGIEQFEVVEMEIGRHSKTEANKTVLRYGLRGWSNFKDADGADVPFSEHFAENLQRLSIMQVVDLSRVIQERTQLNEQEKKA